MLVSPFDVERKCAGVKMAIVKRKYDIFDKLSKYIIQYNSEVVIKLMGLAFKCFRMDTKVPLEKM